MTGLSSARLGRLQASIEADVRARRYFGAVVAVARHGTVALCEAIGHADPESRRPLQRDSVFSLFSVTKAFTNILVFHAMERGDLAPYPAYIGIGFSLRGESICHHQFGTLSTPRSNAT